MKKSLVSASVLGLILIATPTYADSFATPQDGVAMQNQSPRGDEPRDAYGREIREPREHREHEEHGLQIESVAIVIGSIIIAIGLAYGIGRRNGQAVREKATDTQE